MLGNMLEFHGECMAVSTIHHTFRGKQGEIFSANMHASSLFQTFHAYPNLPSMAGASFSNRATIDECTTKEKKVNGRL